ncbi:OsmC family protein [uncultured Streptococcus sp.]|uniref:OsmC family protein n=1 Tax=uncultured Streptococcus sp. TaxID=83427 RepID=UPI0028DC83EB|nr:OsmC family protein [uncultured Streptococcus sp.]
MYQTTIKGDKRYHSLSEGYGAPVELFGYTEDGETPMSLVNIALASCVTMCLQSYFAKFQGIEELAIQVDSSYEEGHFKLGIHLPKDLNVDNEQEILAFVDNYCRVKKLFREDIEVDISLVK